MARRIRSDGTYRRGVRGVFDAARQTARIATGQAEREPRDGHPTHEDLVYEGDGGAEPEKKWGDA